MLLESIVAVTILVGDVDAVERGYAAALDYRTVARGTVAPEQALGWGAGRLAGQDYVLMQPSSGEPVYLRFVEASAPPAPALRHLGWNAIELLVEDPVRLAPRLADSAFRVVGDPLPLSMNPKVVAMQAVGPAGELLYLTRIPSGQSKFGLGSATSFVDRVFIVVLGTQDMTATLDFYRTVFEAPASEPAPASIEVLRKAWALPEGHQFPYAVLRLPERFLIEVDAYPAPATPKPVAPGSLPEGMAMVSFTVPALAPFAGRLVTPAQTMQGPPYAGRRAGVVLGPSGEHIELIEDAH